MADINQTASVQEHMRVRRHVCVIVYFFASTTLFLSFFIHGKIVSRPSHFDQSPGQSGVSSNGSRWSDWFGDDSRL